MLDRIGSLIDLCEGLFCGIFYRDCKCKSKND